MSPLASDESVLVYVGFDRVGDGLLKLPFVSGLRDAFPEARITWLAGQGTSVYGGVMAPAVQGLLDEVVERGRIGESPWELVRSRPGRPLAGRRFDLVIDTQRIFWVSLCVRRIGHATFVSPAAGFRLSDRKPAPGCRFPSTMQRQLLDLLELASGRAFPTPDRLALEIGPDARDQARTLLPEGPFYVGIAPGSGGPPKCWPLARFIALAQSQAARGRVPVFMLGPNEDAWLAEIRAAVPEAAFPLQDDGAQARFGFSPFLAMAVAERLGAAVSNDSGTGHLLACGGTPLVMLYGVTEPSKFRPMTDRLAIVRARDFGGPAMDQIPLAAVEDALARMILDSQAAAGAGSSPTG